MLSYISHQEVIEDHVYIFIHSKSKVFFSCLQGGPRINSKALPVHELIPRHCQVPRKTSFSVWEPPTAPYFFKKSNANLILIKVMSLLILYVTLLLLCLLHHLIKHYRIWKGFSQYGLSICIYFICTWNLIYARCCSRPWRLSSKWTRQVSSLNEAHWRGTKKQMTYSDVIARKKENKVG